MSLVSHRKALALLVSAGLIVAALFAAAPQADAATIYACKNKSDGTIRLVGKKTRCRRGEKKLKWGTSGRNGRNGVNGSNGANGQNGARGPAGAFNVIDQAGNRLGLFAGFGIGLGPSVYTDSGVVLTYDNSPASIGPITLYTALVYKLAGCAGTAYAPYAGYPFEWPVILNVPPAPGSQMYSMIPGTPESFTYESVRTSSGCSNSRAAVTYGFPVRENGVVPIAQEPLRLQPIS